MHKRTSLKNRVHAILFQHGLRAPVDDLFGVGGRRFLDRCELAAPWRSSVATSLYLIDVLEEQITEIERELRRSGADHRYLQLLMSAPGDRLGARLHDRRGDRRDRAFPDTGEAGQLHGLCPRVRQSGEVDRRGALSKHGPAYLRWAMIEAAHGAIRCYPPYRELAERQRARLGRQRGGTVAAISIARKLAEASWWMLTRGQPFAPAGPQGPVTA